MTTGPDTTKGTWIRFVLLTGCFIFVALAWFVHALLAMFGVTLFGTAVSSVPFWKVAEVSSIVVTLVVTVAFWYTYIRGYGEHTPVLQGSGPEDTVRWFGWLGLFALGFGLAGYIAWIEGNVVAQILCLVLGVLAAVQIGLKAMLTTFGSLKDCKKTLEQLTDKAERETKAREVLDKISARDNISKFLCFSDIPIAFAMFMVFLLVVFWVFIPDTEKEMRVFIAGAVALQLLYSNSVYWIEAFADTPVGRRWLDRRSPPFQTVRRMLLPEERPDGMAIVDWAERKLNELFPPENNLATIEPESISSTPSPQQTDVDAKLTPTSTDGEQ